MPILEAHHDRGHPVEDDSAWSESYLLGGYDSVTDAGLDGRIAIRPNEGTADVWMEVWLPGGRYAHVLAARRQTEMIEANMEVAGVRFELVEPMQQWRLVADTEGVMRHHVDRRADQRPVRVQIDMTFTALMPAIGADAQSRSRHGDESNPAMTRFHVGHFEQAMRLRGWIQVDDERIELVDGRGMRDKSWGPRRWDNMPMWRWFALNFGDDVHVGASLLLSPGSEIHRGWLWRDGKHRSLRRVEVKTDLEKDGLHVRRSSLRLLDAEGDEHVMEGEMLWVAEPEIHGNWESESGRTVIHMGLGRWEYDGRVGYGLCDYAHHLGLDGKPLYPIQ